ncbi:MAG TPA: hypothetical protein VK040_09980 [Balneolaceae bacterium]|nr:hypothetical protein [Balneolaceae bacterium]
MTKKTAWTILLIACFLAILILYTNGIPGLTSNQAAVQQDLFAAAEKAQTLWARPALMDGAGRDFSIFDEAELLSRLQIGSGSSNESGNDRELVNKNGTYSVEIHSESSISIRGVPAGRGEEMVLTLNRNGNNDGWELYLNGELE